MKQLLFLLSSVLLIMSCGDYEDEPQFIPIKISDNYTTQIELEGKEGEFFVFTATVTNYSITLTELSNDLDLTFGIYDSSGDYIKQEILAVSKTPGKNDEIIQQTLEPGVDYLIEVFNYEDKVSTGVLSVIPN